MTTRRQPVLRGAIQTLKYCPAFPGRFGSIEDANVFCWQFFSYYNNEHRHSGIGIRTPTPVHDGTAAAIHTRRIATLYEAFLAHPERFRGRRPYPPLLPTKVWINQPPATTTSDTSPQTTQVADVSTGLTASELLAQSIKQQPDFDSRNYGYAKLSDLMAATTLFELDRRSPGDGKPGIIDAHDKRQDRTKRGPAKT